MAIKGQTSVKTIANIFGGADTAKKIKKVKAKPEILERSNEIVRTKEALLAVCSIYIYI